MAPPHCNFDSRKGKTMTWYQKIDNKKLENKIADSGKSKKAICNELDIPYVTLRRWLNGTTERLRQSNIKNLATVLECDQNDLLYIEPNESSYLEQEKQLEDYSENEEFSSLLFQHNPQMIIMFFQKMLTIPSFPKAKTSSLFWLGLLQISNHDLDKARVSAWKIMKMGKTQDDPNIIGQGALLFGAYFFLTGSKRAKGYFITAAELCEKPIHRSLALLFLSFLQILQMDFIEGRLSAASGLKYSTDIKEKKIKSAIQCFFYLNYCQSYLASDVNKLRHYLDKAKYVNLSPKWKISHSFQYVYEAYIYYFEGDYSKTRKLQQHSLDEMYHKHWAFPVVVSLSSRLSLLMSELPMSAKAIEKNTINNFPLFQLLTQEIQLLHQSFSERTTEKYTKEMKKGYVQLGAEKRGEYIKSLLHSLNPSGGHSSHKPQ